MSPSSVVLDLSLLEEIGSYLEYEGKLAQDLAQAKLLMKTNQHNRDSSDSGGDLKEGGDDAHVNRNVNINQQTGNDSHVRVDAEDNVYFFWRNTTHLQRAARKREVGSSASEGISISDSARASLKADTYTDSVKDSEAVAMASFEKVAGSLVDSMRTRLIARLSGKASAEDLRLMVDSIRSHYHIASKI